jgi:ATP adenylyltransferase/5',5'''-P-1,P-4-tetraphosphate phosphorylase II
VLDAKNELEKKASGVVKGVSSTATPSVPVDMLGRAAAEFFVCDLPPAHTLFFNKFPVVKNALIITTKVFEPQTTPLSVDDMLALWTV